MIRLGEQMTHETRENMRDGEGAVTLTPLFKAGDFGSETRMFSRVMLPPGASIGYHVHEGEEEFYYILSGTAEYSENSEIYTIHAGDATVTTTGQGHSLRNTGETPLELIAVIEPVAGKCFR